MKPLSTKSLTVLEFLRGFILKNHYPPTYEEIRAGLGLSNKSLVDYYLETLEEHQLITRQRFKSRRITIC